MRTRSWKSPSGVQGVSCACGPQVQTLAERSEQVGTPRTQLRQVTTSLGPSLTDTSPAPSVPKDEYLADLYHFATKEDTYANYFINVSPRLVCSPPACRARHQSQRVSLRRREGGREGGRPASLTLPRSAPLSPQLMEIQADYHRKSLSSLDAALAELRENHSQAGGDTEGP